MSDSQTKLKTVNKVAEKLLEYICDTDYDDELHRKEFTTILTQDRQDIERVLVERAAARKIKLREDSLISPLENYRIDDQEYGFDIAITLVKEVLQGK